MKEKEILVCPYCSEDGILVVHSYQDVSNTTEYDVVCGEYMQCIAGGSSIWQGYSTKVAAIEAWNRRGIPYKHGE